MDFIKGMKTLYAIEVVQRDKIYAVVPENNI